MAWRSRPNRPELDATKVPTDTDIAWAAGVYEGEGSVRMCAKGKRSLAGQVPQKEPEILYRLRDLFGGSVCKNNSTICYVWNICGDRCRIFMALIYPYLSSKRRLQVDATDALEFLGGKEHTLLNQEDLALHLAAFYEERRSHTWRGTNRSEVRRKNYQRRKSEDPEFLPRLLERNKAWKAKQTGSGNGERL